MAERLGLGVIPGAGWRASDVRAIACEAEAAGFDAIFAAEVNNDVMATAQLMGAATQRINIGTWVANIYVRHSYLCAQGAALIGDATDGRFVLGLGVSHGPVNSALGIDMGEPPEALRRYVIAVRNWLKGEGPATHLPQQPSPKPVPIYVAAVTVTHRGVRQRARRRNHALSLVGCESEASQSVDRSRARQGIGSREA